MALIARPGLYTVLSLAIVARAAAASCACYATNVSDASGKFTMQTFTNYSFIDFRSISGDGIFGNAPPTVNDTQNDGSGSTASPYLNSSTFTNLFALQNWLHQPKGGNASSVALVNSAQNVYVSSDPDDAGATYLTLRTARLQDFQSCAEMDSVTPVQYASLRARARISGAKGACAGIFYFRNDTSESDIEILTDDRSSTFRASNQPDVGPDGFDVPGASTQVPIVVGADQNNHINASYNDWITYRLDWTPTLSVWYINGIMVASKTYGIPRGAANVVLNMWSDGGSWSGNMTVGDSAVMDVQWVEYAYNTSSGGDYGCATAGAALCNVDAEKEVGSPSQTGSVSAATTNEALGWTAVAVGAVLVLMMMTGML